MTGRALDTQNTKAEIMSALANGQTEVALVIHEDAPPVSLAQYIDARDRLHRVWDAPIELVAVDQTWPLTPDQVSKHITIVQPVGGNRTAEDRQEVG